MIDSKGQVNIEFLTPKYNKDNIISNIRSLIIMHKEGRLGGEVMPEDARPVEIDILSIDNYHFLTLPMALNYQRNSYKLWDSAAKTYKDANTRSVFSPSEVKNMSLELLQEKLMQHKLALQPLKHINTWKRISTSIFEMFDGDIRKLFEKCDNDVKKIREFVQVTNKKDFPYLSGPKIFNYWLHVIEMYSPTKFSNRSEISVAPDTHIIQSSIALGLVGGSIKEIAQNRTLVSDEWKNVLAGTEITPIDIHTPLWLWSRKGFPKIRDKM